MTKHTLAEINSRQEHPCHFYRQLGLERSKESHRSAQFTVCSNGIYCASLQQLVNVTLVTNTDV